MNTVSNHALVDGLLTALRTLAGDNAPNDVAWDKSVLGEWGLDSEDGVDLASDLGLLLGVDVPVNENPLIEEDITGRKRARTLREVVDYLTARQALSSSPAP